MLKFYVDNSAPVARPCIAGGIVLITPIMALGVGVGLEEVDAGLGEEAEVVGGPD